MKIKQFVFNPFQENTYVVYTESGDAMIIDPGCSSHSEEVMLTDFLKENSLTLKLVVNTHLHVDHVLGNSFIEKTYGIKALANKDDEYWLKSLEAQAMMFGVALRHELPTLGGYLNEGDTLEFGSDKFQIFQIPGHSPGSIVLYNASQSVVFVGDVLFYSSIGRSDLAGGDYTLLIDGINKKLLNLPDETVVYSGHGPSTTIGQERKSNPFI